MQIPQINKKVIHPELSYKICGLCFCIHNRLGRYRNEKIYSDALEKLFKENEIKHSKEKALDPSFKGEKKGRNIPDFIIEDKIIVGLKAKPIITKDDYFQMQRYLKKKLGLIFNFRQKYLRPKRIINSEVKK